MGKQKRKRKRSKKSGGEGGRRQATAPARIGPALITPRDVGAPRSRDFSPNVSVNAPTRTLALINELHNLVLPPEPAPAPARQIPPLESAFSGRDALINEALTAAGDAKPLLIALDGMAGVGKTAFAIALAHQATRSRRFDAELWLRLRRTDSSRLSVEEAATALVVSLRRAPLLEGEDPVTALSSEMSHRSVLLLIDDATSAEEVRTLMPISGNSAGIVTSREPLALPGAVQRTVPLLQHVAARDLLAAIAPRYAGETEHLDKLVSICGRLPLALRIVASILQTNQAISPSRLISRLATAEERTRRLQFGSMSVSASIEVSLAGLSPLSQQIFFTAARIPSDTASVQLAIALTSGAPPDVEDAIAELARARLIEVLPDTLTFAYHSLVRSYGVGTSPPNVNIMQSLRDALAYYIKAASILSESLLTPDDAPALRWLDRHVSELVALQDVAAAFEPPDTSAVAQIPMALEPYISMRSWLPIWPQVVDRGLAAASGGGHKEELGTLLGVKAKMYHFRRDWPAAADAYRAHLALAREANNARWVTADLLHLCSVLVDGQMDIGEAIALAKEALEMETRSGNRQGLSRAHHGLGAAYARNDEYPLAIHHLSEGLRIDLEEGITLYEAPARSELARLHRLRCEWKEACQHIVRALVVFEAQGRKEYIGRARAERARVCGGAGKEEEAIVDYMEAVRILSEINDPYAAEVSSEMNAYLTKA